MKNVISIALLLYPGFGLTLSECKQWWSLCASEPLLGFIAAHILRR